VSFPLPSLLLDLADEYLLSAANVKQVLTIILAVIIFNLSLNPTNLFGITLTLAGGAFYAKVELGERSKLASALSNTRIAEQEDGMEKRVLLD
jgi:hypothetical protein